MNNKLKTLVSFGSIILLLFSCDSTNPVVPGTIPKMITGTVMDAEEPASGYDIKVTGTNLLAETDSAGNFSIYPIAPDRDSVHFVIGEMRSIFSLKEVLDTCVRFPENADTIIMDTIYLPEDPSLSVRRFYIINEADTVLAYNGLGSKHVFYLNGTIIKLIITFSSRKETLTSSPITVECNDTAIHSGPVIKGRIETELFTISKSNIIKIKDGTQTIDTFEIQDSSYLRTPKPYFRVTASPPLLKASNHTSYGVMIDDSTYSLIYRDSSAIDWDILLVNEETNDSCNYAHCFQCDRYDCPSFGGDYVRFEYGTKYYVPDHISGELFDSSTYAVYVTCFDGPDSLLPAKPIISIETNKIQIKPFLSVTENLYIISTENNMFKGEKRLLGHLKLPEGTFVPETGCVFMQPSEFIIE